MRSIQSFFLVLLISVSALAHAGQFDPSSNIQRLQTAIATYSALAEKGNWPKITGAPKKLEPGDRSDAVPLIRERLAAEGYFSTGKKSKKINPEKAESVVYSYDLQEAIKTYQSRNGLEPDATIGKGTIDALNVSANQRLCQLKVNLSRFEKEQEATLPSKYVRVNIPAYWLNVVENGNSVLDTKVIVGRRDRKTPLFNDEMEYVVMNPAWYVPTHIAVADKLPKVKEDPNYLNKLGMKLYAKGEDGSTTEVDSSTVDWSTVDSKNFNYKIVQKPGRGNALGTIKFLFPNQYDVYLHDTSDRYLFKRQFRPFSSGCIRIEKYVDMAEYVLKDVDGWDRDAIEKQIKSGVQKRVDLKEKLPIRIQYVTAWVDEDGTVQFRDDVYGYDKKVASEVCH